MLPSFKDTTSRHAIIVGMTNTDQVGFQQAKAPAAATIPDNAERIPDAGDGAGGDGGDGGDINEATGLTAEEQAEFDRMAGGGDDPEPPPAGDDDPADGDDDPDGTDGDPQDPPEPAPLGREKTPAELAAEAATGKKPAPKTVSWGKHQRELKAAKAENERIAASERQQRENNIKLAERVAIINEALAAAANQPPPVDPNAPPENPFEEADIDPTVDYAESVKQIQRRQRYQMENQQRTETEFTESREDAQMRDTFERDFAAHASKDPTLPSAYQFLKDSRLTEICISEFDKDPNDPAEIFTPAEVQQMVNTFNAEEKWVVGNALKQKKSPALAIMKLARSRGWKPPAAPAAAPAPAARAAPAAPAARVPAVRNGNGAAAPAVPDAAAALAELRVAQAQGRSLSDGGGAPPQGLSAELLLQLNDDEFAEMVDNLSKHQLDALMGRTPGG